MRKDFRTKKRDSENTSPFNKNNSRDRSNSNFKSNSSDSSDNRFRSFGRTENRNSSQDNRNSNRDNRNSDNIQNNNGYNLRPREDRRDNRNTGRSDFKPHIRTGNTTERDNKIRSRTRHNNSKPTAELGFNEYRLKGIYSSKSKKGITFYTESFNPGVTVYDEKIISIKNIEYREWNPKKSKLGAAIYNGCSQIGIKPGSTVLYLGCSTGTTCSHVSDIIGEGGFLFGLDVAPRVMREFVFLCEKRKNMAPLLKDAHQPSQYSDIVPKVDVVFQDIAQRDQVDIFLKNCKEFLKENGTGMVAIKARSIDVTRRPKEIFEEVRVAIEKEMAIADSRTLEPYEKDHHFFVVKFKKQ